MTSTADVLNRAADLIEERGWVQGEKGWGLKSPGTGLCLEGGLMAALDLPWSHYLYQGCPAYDAVVAHLGRNPQPACAPISDTLWGWNDADGRTASEVIEVLRAVAVIEAAREEAAVEVSA